MKTRLLLAVVAAAALSVVALALWPSSPSSPSLRREVSAAVKAVAAPLQPLMAPRRSGCHFAAGDRFDVRLTAESGVELVNPPAPIPAGSRLTEEVKATAKFEVLQTSDTGAVLVGRLDDVEVSGSVPPSAYGGPFLLEVAPSCEVARFARHQATTLADARLQQVLVWELGFTWTATDERVTRQNGRGSFVATLTTTATPTGVRAQRRIESYATLWLGGEASRVEHFTAVDASGAGWFDTLTLDEALATAGGPMHTTLRAKATTARDALAIDKDTGHYVWGDWLAKAVTRRQAMPVTQTDLQLREVMRNRSPSEAVALAQDSFRVEQNLAKAWPPLRAYLEARPEKTAEVVNELRQAHVTADGINPLFIALGNARTPEARDELLGIVRDERAPPTVRARAMFSLVDRADVGVELAQELGRTAQALEQNPPAGPRFVSGEALLALSTMAGLHEDPAVKDVAVASLRQLLRPTSDRKTQGTALRALANLGDAALLAEAEPYTHSGEERVRRAATKVIRRMHPRDTDEFVRSWLGREPSLFVKKDLFVTLAAQHNDAPAQVSEALGRLLVAELADERHAVIARKALLRLVGNSAVAQEPAVRALLKQQAKRALRKRDGLAGDALQLLTPDEVREVAP